MNDPDLKIEWQKIRMNGEEEFMWVIIGTDILINVEDHNLL